LFSATSKRSPRRNLEVSWAKQVVADRDVRAPGQNSTRYEHLPFLWLEPLRLRYRNARGQWLFLRPELQRGFGAGVDVKFIVDVLEMPANGFEADTEAVGDFLVGKAVDDQFEDFAFARG